MHLVKDNDTISGDKKSLQTLSTLGIGTNDFITLLKYQKN